LKSKISLFLKVIGLFNFRQYYRTGYVLLYISPCYLHEMELYFSTYSTLEVAYRTRPFSYLQDKLLNKLRKRLIIQTSHVMRWHLPCFIWLLLFPLECSLVVQQKSMKLHLTPHQFLHIPYHVLKFHFYPSLFYLKLSTHSLGHWLRQILVCCAFSRSFGGGVSEVLGRWWWFARLRQVVAGIVRYEL